MRLLLWASLLCACGCRTTGDQVARESSGPARPFTTSLAHGDTSLAHGDTRTDMQAEPAPEPPTAWGTAAAMHAPTVRPAAYQQPDETALSMPTPNMLDRGGDAASPQRLPTSPLQLSDLENMALSNNPAIARANAQIRAAEGTWVQTGLPPNPRMGYIAEEMGNAGSAGMQGGFAGQQFVTGHKLALNRQIAAWEVQRAQQELEAEHLRVLTDVRTAYYDVLIAQERRGLAANLVGISEQAVQSAELLFKGEEVSEADPLRARVEAERARIVWENAEGATARGLAASGSSDRRAGPGDAAAGGESRPVRPGSLVGDCPAADSDGEPRGGCGDGECGSRAMGRAPRGQKWCRMSRRWRSSRTTRPTAIR